MLKEVLFRVILSSLMYYGVPLLIAIVLGYIVSSWSDFVFIYIIIWFLWIVVLNVFNKKGEK